MHMLTSELTSYNPRVSHHCYSLLVTNLSYTHEFFVVYWLISHCTLYNIFIHPKLSKQTMGNVPYTNKHTALLHEASTTKRQTYTHKRWLPRQRTLMLISLLPVQVGQVVWQLSLLQCYTTNTVMLQDLVIGQKNEETKLLDANTLIIESPSCFWVIPTYGLCYCEPKMLVDTEVFFLNTRNQLQNLSTSTFIKFSS